MSKVSAILPVASAIIPKWHVIYVIFIAVPIATTFVELQDCNNRTLVYGVNVLLPIQHVII